MSETLPAHYDFGALHRGDTTLLLAVAMSYDTEPAFTAAGATARCQVRDPLTNALVLEWTTEDETLVLVDGGALLMELPPSRTTALRPDRYLAELEITESNGRVRSWLRGPQTVVGDVTRGE